jgi:hypothetical protein
MNLEAENLNEPQEQPLLIADVISSVCDHEFVSREYSSQPYGTCLCCGITVFAN